ncbi:hypothetical protein [Clostridium sp.]|uniref:hypothetical protein n=1 Tax=Clostridium sp. TaxID=1506 RepID=UPI003FD83A47
MKNLIIFTVKSLVVFRPLTIKTITISPIGSIIEEGLSENVSTITKKTIIDTFCQINRIKGCIPNSKVVAAVLGIANKGPIIRKPIIENRILFSATLPNAGRKIKLPAPKNIANNAAPMTIECFDEFLIYITSVLINLNKFLKKIIQSLFCV